MEDFTDSINSTVKETRELIYGDNKSISTNSWKTSFTISFWGRMYNLINYNLSSKDYLTLKLDNSGEYNIEFYDKKNFFEKSEQYKDFPRTQIVMKAKMRYTAFLDITHTILLPEVSKCSNDENYSFLKCTRVKKKDKFEKCHYLANENFRHG